VLTCSRGTWTGDVPISFSYSWVAASGSGLVLAGPSSNPSYTVRVADQGLAIVCQVTAGNDAGTGVARSQTVFVPAALAPFADRPIQQVVFVHGIRADCDLIGDNGQSYQALYAALASQRVQVYSFCYDRDLAFHDFPPRVIAPDRCFSDSSNGIGGSGAPLSFTWNRGGQTSRAGWNQPLPLTQNLSGGERNDGDTALVYDAAKLDACLAMLVRWDIKRYGNPLPIAVIGNSMGGAITRRWLQLAKTRTSTLPDYSLQGVTTVMFTQGATQGSWLAGAGEGTLLPIGLLAAPLADSECQGPSPGPVGCLNPNRAGVVDLAPNSGWYQAIAGSGGPPRLHYYAFATCLQVQINVNFLLWGGAETVGPYDLPGDGLMQLGNGASECSQPGAGGSEFLPFGNHPDQHDYVITRHDSTSVTAGANMLGGTTALYVSGAVAAVFSDRYSHFNWGNKIGQLNVQSSDPTLGQISVLDETTRILASPSDPAPRTPGPAPLVSPPPGVRACEPDHAPAAPPWQQRLRPSRCGLSNRCSSSTAPDAPISSSIPLGRSQAGSPYMCALARATPGSSDPRSPGVTRSGSTRPSARACYQAADTR
jgi:hypothetical protein